ncbi:carboxymuconolactone decarboxylase family protein [Streptomyces sp. NPDC050388]|uniref:carboxymuconolactone decarboxylase family protein n=1 Tax=Streptomyces sp. NPDC050388 TaxID=3155781 RepID=UPI00341D2B6F
MPAGPGPAVWSRRARTEVARAVRGAARDAGSNRPLTELVGIRASQIDGCASCPDVHVRAAVRGKEPLQRIAVLSACGDTGLFAPDERAAVVLTASLTVFPTPYPGPGPRRSVRHLISEQTSAVAWAVLTIHAISRVPVVSRHTVPSRAVAAPPVVRPESPQEGPA